MTTRKAKAKGVLAQALCRKALELIAPAELHDAISAVCRINDAGGCCGADRRAWIAEAGMIQCTEGLPAKFEVAVLSHGEDPSQGKVDRHAVWSAENVAPRIAEAGGRNRKTRRIEPLCDGAIRQGSFA